MNILKRLTTLFHPERFQGWGKARRYFEGWYFKVVNADGSRAFAFIPGIAMDANGQQQSFIQVLDGTHKRADYHRFPIEAFSSVHHDFRVQIHENYFHARGLQLNLEQVKGALTFSGNAPWPKRLYSPGIMGPFSFVPFMECYHGIVSMDHSISGTLEISGEHIDMNGGRGYIEKDWGRSFPSAYVWMQSNHFSTSGTSLKCSVARIPWLSSSFVGFIAGLWWEGRLIRFTTYNGTRLHTCRINERAVRIELEGKEYRLIIEALRTTSTSLASPIQGLMDGRIEESMTAQLHIQLVEKKTGAIVLDDTGVHAGLEVAGTIEHILTP